MVLVRQAAFDLVVADELQPLDVLGVPRPAEDDLDLELLLAGLNDVRLAGPQLVLLDDDPHRRGQRLVVQVAGPAKLRVVRIAEAIEVRIEQEPVGVGDRGPVGVERVLRLVRCSSAAGRPDRPARRYEQILSGFGIGLDLLLQAGQRDFRVLLAERDQVVTPQELRASAASASVRGGPPAAADRSARSAAARAA